MRHTRREHEIASTIRFNEPLTVAARQLGVSKQRVFAVAKAFHMPRPERLRNLTARFYVRLSELDYSLFQAMREVLGMGRTETLRVALAGLAKRFKVRTK